MSPSQSAEDVDDAPAKEPDCILIDSSDEEGDEPPPPKRACAEATTSAHDAGGGTTTSLSTPLSPAHTPTAHASSPSAWSLSPHGNGTNAAQSSMSPSSSLLHTSSPISRSVSHPPPLSMPSLVRMNSPPLSSPSPSSSSSKYPSSGSPSWRPPKSAHSSTASPPAMRPRPAHLSQSSSSPSASSLSAPPTPVALTRSLTGQSYNVMPSATGYPFYPPLPIPTSTRSPSTTSFHSHESLSTPPGGRISPSAGISGVGSFNDVASSLFLSGSSPVGNGDGGMNGLDLRTSTSGGSRGGAMGGNAGTTLPHELLADFASVEPFFSTQGFIALD